MRRPGNPAATRSSSPAASCPRPHSARTAPPIAATSNDGTVQLWNAQTGGDFGPALTGHTAAVNSVAFSPDSRTIVTGSLDKTLRLWPVPTMDPDALCAKLTQNMSHETWNYWVPGIAYHKQCPDLPERDD